MQLLAAFRYIYIFRIYFFCITRDLHCKNKQQKICTPSTNSKKILFIIYLLPTVVRKRIQTVSNNQLKNADSLKFLLSDELFMFMFLRSFFFFSFSTYYTFGGCYVCTFINKFEIIYNDMGEILLIYIIGEWCAKEKVASV